MQPIPENTDEYLIKLITNKINYLVTQELHFAFTYRYTEAAKIKDEIKDTLNFIQKTYPNVTCKMLLEILEEQIWKVSEKIGNRNYYPVKYWSDL